MSLLGLLICGTVALLQRGAVVPPEPVLLSLVLVVAGPLLQLITSIWVPWWVMTLSVLAGTAWLLADPLHVDGPADAAPGLLMILVGEVMASKGVVAGWITTASAVALLGVFDVTVGLPGLTIYLLQLLLGLAVGYMLLWQARALTAARVAQENERARATLAERERIAREIHDLVAHSLSVTLLHVTGARHALGQTQPETADMQEAIASLADAERIGRQAMADIRRTVATLAGGQRRPLPSAQDVGGLVEEVRAAGLEVDYHLHGDLEAVEEAAGLGLYRIVQESLANVAKHAPSKPVTVLLDVRDGAVHLEIANPRPPGRVRTDAAGSGVAGMSARAVQLGGVLTAGPRDDAWVVELSVPAPAPSCELDRIRLPRWSTS